DRLEAPLEGRVFLDVLSVLVERGRADTAQLAARQGRLEHVGGVDRALSGAGAHQRGELVDEADDLARRLVDVLQHGLQAVLELAAVLRAGHQRADVERDQLLTLQPFGHVAGDDPLREALDDRGLADAGLADEDRVVLGAAREHLDDAANLLVAADDRVELAAAREIGEIAGVALERLVLLLGVRIGHALVAADLDQRLVDRLGADAGGRQETGGGAVALLRQGQEEGLGGSIVAAEALPLALRPLDYLSRALAKVLAARAPYLRHALERRVHLAKDRVGTGAELGQDRTHHAPALLEQRAQQMLGLDRLVGMLVGPRL